MPDIVTQKLSLTDEQWQTVSEAIFAGRKIEAIHLLRGIMPHWGLADAKAGVEQMERDLRAQQPERFVAEKYAPRNESHVAWRGLTVAVIILAVAGYLIFKLLHK